MTVPPRNPVVSKIDLWSEIEAALREEDDAAAREHLVSAIA
jgi:hypothetical protein